MTGAAFSFAPVEGAVVEPGLRAALDDALARSMAARGVGKGETTVRLELVSALDPEGGVPGADAGTVAYTSGLQVIARADGLPGCEVQVSLRGTWVQPDEDAQQGSVARASRLHELSVAAAERIVDGLLAREACR